jgi:drug/metabolite transporter (DMT)-like permease
MALLEPSIDPASFTTIRLASGAAMLLLVTSRVERVRIADAGSLASPVLLTLYAVPFSFAYTRLTTGTGALILFACVQLTMLAATIRSGETIRAAQWTGVSIALAGLVWLVAPTLATPALLPTLLMAVAGIAWGVYSWRGRAGTSPLTATTVNFVYAVPFALIASVLSLSQLHVEPRGALLAMASGAAASALGYVVWYAALHGLSGAQAAVVQLSVPVIAAAGGVLVLGEALSARLVLSGILVLGGIALAVTAD